MLIYILLLLIVVLSESNFRTASVVDWNSQQVKPIRSMSRQQVIGARGPFHTFQRAKQNPTRSPQMRHEDNGNIDTELSCLVKLYEILMKEEWLSEVSFSASADDRVIFLIPLIIIYWHHRHPHKPIPFGEIEGLLQRMDDDQARAEQIVLRHMMTVLGARGKCLEVSTNERDSYLEQIKTKKMKRQSDAIQLLNNWIEDMDKSHMLPLGDRQSGIRSMSALLKALANIQKRPIKVFEDGYASTSSSLMQSVRGRIDEHIELATTSIPVTTFTESNSIRELNVSRGAITTTTRSHLYNYLETTVKPSPAASVLPSSSVKTTMTTTTTSSLSESQSTDKTIVAPLSDHSNISMIIQSSGSDSSSNATMTTHLVGNDSITTVKNFIESSSISSTTLNPLTTSNAYLQLSSTYANIPEDVASNLNHTNCKEIFGFVSSIFDEMDQIYNSTNF